MKRFISALIVFAMLLGLCACGAPAKEDIDYKAVLTKEGFTYSADELEDYAAMDNVLVSANDLPALYKYFEGKCDIGVAFGANQIYPFFDENVDFTAESTDPNVQIAQGIAKHYNMYVLGNELKSDHCNPAPDTYNFDDGDKLVEFGKAAGAKLRGHTIVWHSQVPQWWFKADPNDQASLQECYQNGKLATREQLTERLETYITELRTHFKDDIKIWDVCNEVLNASGIRQVADDSYWAEIIGDVDGNGYADDYVEIAFNKAREVGGEDLVLMINDFNLEWQDSKVNAMYDMVERMLRKGVRIDGVGFQSHISVDCNVEKYRSCLEKIASLSEVYDECFPEHKGNFRIQITELDMNMFVGAIADEGYYTWSDEDFARQADKYAELTDMFLDLVDEGKIDAIVFWGTDDENSWLNTTPKLRRNAAMLVDRDLTLKPCFWSIARTALAHGK